MKCKHLSSINCMRLETTLPTNIITTYSPLFCQVVINMKTLALLFTLSLYLLPNPTHSSFNPIRLPTADVAVASGTPVLDTDGNQLQAGETYYITSTGSPGALTVGVRVAWSDSTTECVTRLLLSRPLLDGQPIRIRPADPNAPVVLTSSFQSFEFITDMTRVCLGNVYWGIRYDQPTGNYLLNTTEFVPNLSSQFKIEVVPEHNAYRITNCPFGGHNCNNVGLIDYMLHRDLRLALTANSFFSVVFKKARL
ncbi:PREDICTED: sporamin B-like [Ipomoea nil]|uniref:sporamin B-like n=1 Tax=Ipomoea nil TaxID=35883 RepID=UPI000901BC94|nr:PREDICTED: sporamin B-like [Ipomoea nil]